MLFDLRGRGRRRAIKVIYVTLAVLMGGGLVLFGIGGDVSGGLVDAITERGGGGDNTAQKQEQAALAKVRQSPSDPAAWAELARRRFLTTSSDDELFDSQKQQFTDRGKAKLREADSAWKKHLELAGDNPDDRVASIMLQVYDPLGLDKKDDAVRAQEIIAEARPSVGTLSNLAIYAYLAGQTRKGDLAAEKAVELADKADRKTVKATLEAQKQQALQQSVQDAGGSPSPAATLPGG